MKKILLFVLCILFPLCTFAYDLKSNGIYYNLDHASQTATVTYATTSYNSYSGTVSIPDYVTTDKGMDYDVVAISDNAFRNSTGMTSVTIGTGVTSIGANAFYGCSGITSVRIPNAVTTLGASCFRGCSKITEMTLAAGLTTLPTEFLYGCSSLRTITLPKNLTSIANYAFYGCSSLTTVNFSTALTTIGDYAFRGCTSLNGVSLPASVTAVGKESFYGCSKLSSLNLNEGLKSLGESAFASCTSLTDITLPSTVETIGANVFYGSTSLVKAALGCKFKALPATTFKNCSGLTTVILPTQLTSIGAEAFSGCTQLASLDFPSTLSSVTSTAFTSCSNLKQLTFAEGMKTIPRTYAYSVTHVNLPSSATTIATEAFASCTKLVSVTLPANVRTINSKAFSGCTSLTDVILSNRLNSIGAEAFRNCTSLPSVVIPASVSSIGTNAFADCTNLVSLEYAEGTTTALRTYATRLTTLTLPSTCYAIADDAFTDCSALSRINISNLEMWNLIFSGRTSDHFSCDHYIYINGELLSELTADFGAPISNYAFANTKGLKVVNVPVSVTAIGTHAFSGDTDLQSVVMANGVKTIGSNAFLSCSSLENIRIGSAVTTIGSNAFYGCSALNSVLMGGKEQSIGDAAFKGCTSLSEIRLPASLRTLGANAFEDCKKLTSINLPEGLSAISASTFSGCSVLKDVTIPSSVTAIGSSAFYNCPLIEILDLPNSVSTIGTNAFSQCKGLNFATVGTGIKTIDSGAFSNCTMLKAFYCLAPTAPTTNSNAFSGSDPASITLYVPDESVSSYSGKSPWSTFATTLGLSAGPTYMSSLTLSPEVLVLSDDPLDENYIKATVFPADATNTKVTWTSSNTSVATVSRTGLVSPIAEGVATITCTASDKHGAQSTALVIVKNRFQSVTSLSLDHSSVSLTEGQRMQLVPTTLPLTASYDALSWTTSDSNIAIVSPTGVVTAISEGSAEITAATGDGSNLTASCMVLVEAPMESSTIGEGDVTGDGAVDEDDLLALKNHLFNRTAETGVDYDVNHDGIVTVADMATIKALIKGENEPNVGPLKFLSVSSSYSMSSGATKTITPQFVPYRAGRHLVWTTDDETLVKLTTTKDGACIVEALAPGRVNLTVSANDGSGLSRTVVVDIAPGYGVTDGHQWVDLGLPSGTLWATSNIGASAPEAYGSYIAWGETAAKSNYSWTTYALANGSSTTLKKYCTASAYGTRDDKEVLESADDAACQLWSENWTMPTNIEFEELFNEAYTTSKWTVQSGIAGRLVTSKTTGCSLFLPAAGYMNGTAASSAGTGGYYASKNLASPSIYAYGLNFGESSVAPSNTSYRHYGLSARPVLVSKSEVGPSVGETPTQKIFTVNGVTFNMNLVEHGTFQMGSDSSDAYDSEKPVHTVTISKDYYIGETEVTQALWYAVMGQKPTSDGNKWSSLDGLGDDYPAYYINWDDCQTFITKLNQLTGQTFRMPTEAEWEYAAKGGNKSQGYTYSGSNTIDNVAWYTDNSGSKAHPVATKQPNELGIYDMSGNVYEWCQDWYGSYSSSAQTNPTGPSAGSTRVIRGGSFYYDAKYSRVALHNGYKPSNRNSFMGFRLALDPSNTTGGENPSQNPIEENLSPKTFTVGGVTFNMIPVEHGTFEMGKSADGNDVTPVHTVTISKDYYVGETEVTQALWYAVMRQKPTAYGNQWSEDEGLGDNYPAYFISWNECQTFITKLNQLTGQTFRMPTEAEWEFAAKGGNKSQGYKYSGSNTYSDVANFYYKKTLPVATKQPNELGIYDMSGNVCEWCSDRYGPYSSSAVTDPTGPSSGDYLDRGGCWQNNTWRVVQRGSFRSSGQYDNFAIHGLRLALSPSK